MEEAKQAVQRLTNPELVSETDCYNTVAMMKHTTELEIQAAFGTSYIDCFRGIDRRRTEIVMMTFAMQLLSGQNLIGQGIQFLQTAGISTDLSFSLNMVLNSMFVIGTFFSWGCKSFFLSFVGPALIYSTQVLRSTYNLHCWYGLHVCCAFHHRSAWIPRQPKRQLRDGWSTYRPQLHLQLFPRTSMLYHHR